MSRYKINIQDIAKGNERTIDTDGFDLYYYNNYGELSKVKMIDVKGDDE